MKPFSLRTASLALVVLVLAPVLATGQAWAATRFQVSLPQAHASGPVTGRLIIAVSTREKGEPRMQMSLNGAAMFGVDVEGLKPGQSATVDQTAPGYQVDDLSKLPAGDYTVQAVVIRYTQVKRKDGKVLWVPVPGKIDQTPFFALPGNLYSEPQRVRLDPAKGFDVKLDLAKTIQPEPPMADTPWIKRVWIRSKLLSDFWGADMYLGASVLLPRGYDENPKARYPVAYVHGHGSAPFSFNPDPASHQPSIARARAGEVETGYEFFQSWNSEKFPRFLAVTIYQQSPFFLDAYSTNSLSHGPYGDAVTQELMPYIEKKFRAIGKPYARIVEGASTGGWTSLSEILKYPDFFGGAWIFNPDPIDFTRYQLVDIYEDDNAFATPLSPLMSTEIPFRRTVEGRPTATNRQLSRYETVMGSKGRSGGQINAWEAIHGPLDAEGYPMPIWDKETGKIDKTVANWMRENGYDLSDYTRRNWAALGPKINGKIFFIQGEMDNFYLNLAVYKYEAMLKDLKDPKPDISFVYGRPMKGHSWHEKTWAGVVRDMAEHVKKFAPAGEDTAQWNY